MPSPYERVLSTILVGCAIVIAGGVARRELWKPAQATGPIDRVSPTERIAGWEEALEVGLTIGSKTAPVKIVEFADLQCPACRRFQGVIHELLTEYPKDVALVFVHLPLDGHPSAIPAARAAECAASKGRFYPFIQALYAKQDSLGVKSWGSFAAEAGIGDSTQISECAKSGSRVKRIASGIALAQKLQVIGTPTVIVNGWRFTMPTKENLIRAVVAVRKGKPANEISVQ